MSWAVSGGAGLAKAEEALEDGDQSNRECRIDDDYNPEVARRVLAQNFARSNASLCQNATGSNGIAHIDEEEGANDFEHEDGCAA